MWRLRIFFPVSNILYKLTTFWGEMPREDLKCQSNTEIKLPWHQKITWFVHGKYVIFVHFLDFSSFQMSFLILVGYNIFSTKAMMQVEKFSSKLLFSIRHKHFKRFGCIAFAVMALFLQKTFMKNLSKHLCSHCISIRHS